MQNELKLINSVCSTKDLNVLMTRRADEMMVAYGDVWTSIKSFYSKYRTIPDIEILQTRHKDLEKVEATAPSQFYMDLVRNEFLNTKLESIARDLASSLGSAPPSGLLRKVTYEASKLEAYSNEAVAVNIMDLEAAEQRYDEVRARAELMGGVPGIPTGISFIDSAVTSGFVPGDLIVVLGWTGRAKSLFTTLIACNAYRAGLRPMIISHEMTPAKVQDRVLTILGSGIFENSQLSLGDIDPDIFRDFKGKVDGSEFIVQGAGGQEITPNYTSALIQQHRPDLLIYDYAQLGTDNSNSNDMTARMRNMSKEFKKTGEAAGIPIILISSATPDNTASMKEPPIVEQVAWSKQLASDADYAFAVHKHDDSNIVEIVCRKNRNGPRPAGYLDWDINRGLIEEKFDI